MLVLSTANHHLILIFLNLDLNAHRNLKIVLILYDSITGILADNLIPIRRDL